MALTRNIQIPLPPTPLQSVSPVRSPALEGSDAATALLEDVRASLDDAQIKVTAAAAYMGLSVSLLSRQLRGHEHLSAKRLSLLPPEFWGGFIVRRARRFGFYIVPKAKRQARLTEAMLWLSRLLDEAS